jgi:hypothetical protein
VQARLLFCLHPSRRSSSPFVSVCACAVCAPCCVWCVWCVRVVRRRNPFPICPRSRCTTGSTEPSPRYSSRWWTSSPRASSSTRPFRCTLPVFLPFITTGLLFRPPLLAHACSSHSHASCIGFGASIGTSRATRWAGRWPTCAWPTSPSPRRPSSSSAPPFLDRSLFRHVARGVAVVHSLVPSRQNPALYGYQPEYE